MLTTPTGPDEWSLSLKIDCIGLQWCAIQSWSPDIYDTDLGKEVPILVTGYGPNWTPDLSNPLRPVFNAIEAFPPANPDLLHLVDATVAVVPESPTWIALVAGFGVMGLAMRRRPAAVQGLGSRA